MPEITIPQTTRLFIATPAYQATNSSHYTQSALGASNFLSSKGVRHTVRVFAGAGFVAIARNILVAQFMAEGFTHLLFIDSDIEFRPEAITRLLAASFCDGSEVCCGVYPLKQKPLKFPVNFVSGPDGNVVSHPDTGYLELKDACTGFLMIRREVITRMMAAYPERQCHFRPPAEVPEAEAPYEYNLFDCYVDPVDRMYLTEDYGFSRLYQGIGGRIWADPDTELPHHGYAKYTGKLADLMVNG